MKSNGDVRLVARMLRHGGRAVRWWATTLCASAMIVGAMAGAHVAVADDRATNGRTDVSLGSTVTASGQEVAGKWGPELTADGKGMPEHGADSSVHNAADASRWSANTDNKTMTGNWWLQYQFASTVHIDEVSIEWGNTYATAYRLQVSENGSQWTTVGDRLVGKKSAKTTVTLKTPVDARYLRMVATQKSQKWALSVWEVYIMGVMDKVADNPVQALTPKPLVAQALDGQGYVLDAKTCVSLSDDSLKPAAALLRDALSASYGVGLTQSTGACGVTITRDPQLSIASSVDASQSVQANEAYILDSDANGVRITAVSAQSAIWGVQTLLQLVGPWAHSATRVAQEARVPAAHIVDAPRYQWRGLTLDVARSFSPTDEVKRMIDVMSSYKYNVLHLHLSDDESFRVQITNEGRVSGDTVDYTKLAEVSSTGSYNHDWAVKKKQFWTSPINGRTGYYTQEEFIDLVAYAADRGISIIPEIDGPAHSMGMLHALPELNVGNALPKPAEGKATAELTYEQWGKTSLATDSEVTYTVMGHIMSQLRGMIEQGLERSGMPVEVMRRQYFHIGGDELAANANDLTQRMQTYLGKLGKQVKDSGSTVIVWNDGMDAADQLPDGTVVQVWTGRADDHNGRIQSFVREHNGKIIMSPVANTYVAQKPGKDTVGPDWACGASGCDTAKYYNWNPTTQAYVNESDMLGVEAALWSEHVRTLSDAEFMMFPRMLSTAEVAWTQQNLRNYANWNARVGLMGIDLMNRGVNFHVAGEVTSWQAQYVTYDAVGADVSQPVRIGGYAEPKIVDQSAVKLRATFQDDTARNVVELPVTVSMEQGYQGQQVNEQGQQMLYGTRMNGVANVSVDIPESLRNHAQGTITVQGGTGEQAGVNMVSSTVPIRIERGKVMAIGALSSEPTPEPSPQPSPEPTPGPTPEPAPPAAGQSGDDATPGQGATNSGPRSSVTLPPSGAATIGVMRSAIVLAMSGAIVALVAARRWRMRH